MTIDADLASLLQNPKAFLERNALIIYGTTKGGSGIKNFVFQGSDETGWRSASAGQVPFYVIYQDGTFNGKGSGPKSKAFEAHYISMREYNADTRSWEDSSATHYTLPGGDGPAIMVTSKLNGCTFGIGSKADGSRLVSHLRPPSGDNQSARLLLDKGTRAGFAGGNIDVSVMSSQSQNGTVIGKRAGSNWTFYAQRFQIFANAVGTITDVQVYG